MAFLPLRVCFVPHHTVHIGGSKGSNNDILLRGFMRHELFPGAAAPRVAPSRPEREPGEFCSVVGRLLAYASSAELCGADSESRKNEQIQIIPTKPKAGRRGDLATRRKQPTLIGTSVI